MISPKALLTDLQQEVKKLQADLRPTGEADSGLHQEWQDARTAGRTAAAFPAWLTDRVTQVAVAWVLATVFVRFAEDNTLIEYPYLAGPGERTDQARERQEQFFYEHPELTDRDWIEAAFDEMGKSPVAKALFAEHNPMWSIRPSNDAAKALIAFWRKTDANGKIVHDFTDDTWNTRFLGDLYQDLSEETRKTYALLQTPEFVEEFILKYTLDPAIEEFGLEPEPPYGHPDLPRRLRVIDPACGSGHFLLGAFRRLLAAWRAHSPMADDWQLIANAISSVHGVDKNPYAAAIARFRLMLAAMREAGVERLTDRVDFPLNIAVGDSLLHGRGAPGTAAALGQYYITEDVADFFKPPVEILSSGTYHVVVGNPPYITPQDAQERKNYRAYKSCSGKYVLTVPFAERMFQLAIRGAYEGDRAGYVGQITANSFMKREFGKKLIEEYFPTIDLTYVIDTSGAFIPGHGTPTVILIGRRRWPRSHSTVRAVLSVRGEPSEPPIPADGFVWQAIEKQVDQPGSESEWVSVVDFPREHFAKHPWSLSGGGSSDVFSAIEHRRSTTIGDIAESVGITAVTGEDDLYLLPRTGAAARHRIEKTRPFTTGDRVRDFNLLPESDGVWTYNSSFEVERLEDVPATATFLMPYKTVISRRRRFGTPMIERGLKWYEWQELYVGKLRTPLSIAFAFVSTHNHFVLDRGGKVFNRSAPVVKLPETATEDDHLGLLAVLNSSTACFWLKQVSHDKGNRGGERSTARFPWENFYEFTGTKLEAFPLVTNLPVRSGRELDALAHQRAAADPSSVCASEVPTRARLDAARAEHQRLFRRMVALQEELDWDVYRRYGLISETEAAELIAPAESVPELNLGERAFEFLLAERLDGTQGERQWFERHRSTPITEIPVHWADAYKQVVARRIEFIKADRNTGLIERPECKRRWESEIEPWEKRERVALTVWLLDRCEDRSLWYGPDDQPRPLTVNALADRLRTDEDFISVARLLAGEDADLADVLKTILADEHVPFLAQYRYKGEGLIKRAVWEQTWNLQREEDRTGEKLEILVPPRYGKTDFQRDSFWRHRGKLDVPKERFISYPAASPDGDASLLLGWAGWDHREQAYALISLITQRSATDGWGKDRLTPLIAGLAEVMPCVRQWHTGIDPAFGQSPAAAYDEFLTAQRITHHLTDQDLASVKPPKPAGRRKAAKGANPVAGMPPD